MSDDNNGNGIIGFNGLKGTPPFNGNNTDTARWQLIVSAAAVVLAIGGALLSLLLNINTLTNTAASLNVRLSNLETIMNETQNR